MVTVGMGNDDAADMSNPRGKKLLAQVGTAVDQHALACAFHEYRRTKTRVARFFGIASAPLVPDPGYASRGAAAKNADLHAAFLKSLKKLPVVVSAN